MSNGPFTTLGDNDAYSSATFTYTLRPGASVSGNYMVRILSIAEPGGGSNTYAFPGNMGIRYGFS